MELPNPVPGVLAYLIESKTRYPLEVEQFPIPAFLHEQASTGSRRNYRLQRM